MEAGVLKTISTFALMAVLSMPAVAGVQIVERDGRFELQAPNESPRCSSSPPRDAQTSLPRLWPGHPGFQALRAV